MTAREGMDSGSGAGMTEERRDDKAEGSRIEEVVRWCLGKS